MEGAPRAYLPRKIRPKHGRPQVLIAETYGGGSRRFRRFAFELTRSLAVRLPIEGVGTPVPPPPLFLQDRGRILRTPDHGRGERVEAQQVGPLRVGSKSRASPRSPRPSLFLGRAVARSRGGEPPPSRIPYNEEVREMFASLRPVTVP